MRMHSFTIPKRLLALALLLAVAFILSFGGVAHASTATAAPKIPTPLCITAAPPTQEVSIDQLAKVAVTIYCEEPYVGVVWGDGTTSRYPVCLEVCHVPPITIEITHTYTTKGDYHPEICLSPSPLPPETACTSVEIVVV